MKRAVLLGDSHMGGPLGNELAHELGARGFEVERAYQVGSGLARPDSFDWIDWARWHKGPDLAVISVGANDGQSLTDPSVPWSSPEWGPRYGERVRELWHALGAKKTIFVGPASSEFQKNDEAMDRVASYQQQAMLEDFVPNPLRPYSGELRTPDGVHYTPAGAHLVAESVLREVDRAPEPEHGGIGTVLLGCAIAAGISYVLTIGKRGAK